MLFDRAWITRYPHMLLYVCRAKKEIPRCLDYNASVRLSNGRPVFKSLWISERLRKVLQGVRPLHMQLNVKPSLTFWPKGMVNRLPPEYVFRVPAECKKEKPTANMDEDEEPSISMGLGWVITPDEMEDSEDNTGRRSHLQVMA